MPGPLLLAAAALSPRGPAPRLAPHFLLAGAGRGPWNCGGEAGARSVTDLCGEQPSAMPAAGPAASPAEPQAPAAAEPLRRGRRRKPKVLGRAGGRARACTCGRGGGHFARRGAGGRWRLAA